jgi:hypothetical protein
MSTTLLMPFINQSVDYVLGVELGILWEKFEQGVEVSNYLIRQDNLEQIKMMCEVFHLDISVEHLSEGWANITTHNRIHDLLDNIL